MRFEAEEWAEELPEVRMERVADEVEEPRELEWPEGSRFGFSLARMMFSLTGCRDMGIVAAQRARWGHNSLSS